MPTRATAPALLTGELRRRVLVGELRPGQPLREEDLAEGTGHSRHTVRAALAALVAERLAVAEPYRGVRVTSFDDADVVALQQLRGALECEAVRLLREQHGTTWPAEVVAPVEEAVAGLAQVDPDDWPTVAAAHARVHQQLVAAARSPRLTETHDQLGSELLLLLVHVRPAYTLAALVDEHLAYLAEVQQHGPVSVRRHLDHATGTILRARGEPAGDAGP